MLFFRIKTLFLTLSLFFSMLFSGNISYFSKNYVYCNYQYGEHERQCLDLIIPKSVKGDAGLMLFIHGGGYTSGSKDEYRDMMFYGADMYDCAFASINYRYASDSVGFEEITDDISSALTAIKKLAAERGVNLTKMVLNGTSAGAHLSLLYAYKYKDVSPIKPVGVVSFCGVTDFSDINFYNEDMLWNMEGSGFEYMNTLFSYLFKETVNESTFQTLVPKLLEYSPVNYVDSDTVPTVIYHGEKDVIVPFSNAVSLSEKLKAAGVDYKFVPNPNVGHNIYEDKKYSNEGNGEICLYIEKYLINE